MRKLKLVFPLAISGILLSLVFWQIDQKNLYAAISNVPLSPIIISLVLVFSSVYLKMQRWKSLVRILKNDVRSVNILSCNCIGALSDNLLMTTSGELIRAFLLGRKENIRSSSLLGTVIIERQLDILLVLLITSSALFFFGTNDSRVILVVSFGVFLLAAVFIGMILMTRYTEFFVSLANRWGPRKYITQIEGSVRFFAHGLIVVKNIRQMIQPVALTLLMWVCITSAVVPVLYAFEFGTQVSVAVIFTILLFLTVGLSLPSAPAGIGVFEYACYLALIIHLPDSLLESPATLAEIGVFSVLLHLTFSMPEVILGCFFLGRQRLRISGLFRLSRKIRSDI